MSKMHQPVTLPGKHNPFGVTGMRGVIFEGTSYAYPGRAIDFCSTLYATRSIYSLLRYWQRSKGARTLNEVINCIYWLDDPHKVGLKGFVEGNYNLALDADFDYHSEAAQTFVRALAMYMTTFQVKGEDLQCAQLMIL